MKLSYRFTPKKNTGGLLIPSEAVVKICQVAETYIRKVMALTGNRIPSEDNLFPSLTIIISQKFYATSDQLFPTLVDHCLSFPSNEEKHTFILIKQIVNAYLRIRIFSLAKKYTDRIQGPSVRQALNKLILFNHQ
ncbi:hypothetical protein QE152_g10617 [Popillia japonica]|uniref:Uncharacterized protein n=1 Tax=Popillia japonica TaxID=7064 RepID=A0AAW1LU98_POPJA